MISLRVGGLMAILAVAGCPSPPRQADTGLSTPPRPVCEVWTQRLLGRLAVKVEGEQASSYGLFGAVQRARFTGDGQDIVMASSLTGVPIARLTDNQLVFASLLLPSPPIVIGERTAMLPSAIVDTRVDFNDACTTRDAALGVATIVELLREERDDRRRRETPRTR